MNEINKRIFCIRKTLKLSQPDFGRNLGVSRDVINNIERKDGRAVEPKMLFLEHLCKIYKVNLDWLLHGEGEMFVINGNDQTVADRIKLVRDYLEMTQTELGESIGVSRNVINSYERGKVSPPQTTIELLRLKLNVNPEWLNSGRGEMLCSTDNTEELVSNDIPFNDSTLKRMIHSPDLIDRSISFLQVIRMITFMDQHEKDLIVSYLKGKDSE